MILSEMLHASMNRVVDENTSIVRRRAFCALGVMLSASSKITILCRPGGRVICVCAKVFILPRTTSIPRSFDALSSSNASLVFPPSSFLAKTSIEVVLPMPAVPQKSKLGKLPLVAKDASLSTVSLFPQMSENSFGRCFSSQGRLILANCELASIYFN